MVEDHGAPEPGPEVLKRQRVAIERVAQRVSCWAMQNEMRGVLGRVSAGAPGRILNSANSSVKRRKRGSRKFREG